MLTLVFLMGKLDHSLPIYLLKNHNQLEHPIELAHKNSTLKSVKVEFIVKQYLFSDSVLIYDESQELLKPLSLRLSEWRANRIPIEFGCPH